MKASFMAQYDRVHAFAFDDKRMRKGKVEHSTMKVAKQVVGAWQDGDFALPTHILSLGIPLHGRNVKDFSKVKPYREILDLEPDLREKPGRDEAKTRDGTFFFNNLKTVQEKVRYAQRNKMAGVALWDLANDLHPTDAGSITRSVYKLVYPKRNTADDGNKETSKPSDEAKQDEL